MRFYLLGNCEIVTLERILYPVCVVYVCVVVCVVWRRNFRCLQSMSANWANSWPIFGRVTDI